MTRQESGQDARQAILIHNETAGAGLRSPRIDRVLVTRKSLALVGAAELASWEHEDASPAVRDSRPFDGVPENHPVGAEHDVSESRLFSDPLDVRHVIAARPVELPHRDDRPARRAEQSRNGLSAEAPVDESGRWGCHAYAARPSATSTVLIASGSTS